MIWNPARLQLDRFNGEYLSDPIYTVTDDEALICCSVPAADGNLHPDLLL